MTEQHVPVSNSNAIDSPLMPTLANFQFEPGSVFKNPKQSSSNPNFFPLHILDVCTFFLQLKQIQLIAVHLAGLCFLFLIYLDR